MNARNVHVRTKTFVMFLLSVCIIVLSQVNASFLDPSKIGMELQMFARDALGVDEMQVRELFFANSECMLSAIFSLQLYHFGVR